MDLNNLNIVEVLKIGVIGLGFLLAVLSFKLLSSEQKREGEPRPSILKAIYVFMAFSIGILTLGIGSEIIKCSKEPGSITTVTTETPQIQVYSGTPSFTLGPLSPKSLSKLESLDDLIGTKLTWSAKRAYSGSVYEHFDCQKINVAVEFSDPRIRSLITDLSNDELLVISGTLLKSPSQSYLLIGGGTAYIQK